MKSKQAEQVFDLMMSKDYCSQWMGIEAVEIKEAYCKIKMTVKKEMLNGFGILHGGIAYAFADSAFAFASNSLGRVALSINGTMSFNKPAKKGELLFAEAKALSISYKTAEFDVDVSNEAGDIYYRFRGMVYRKSDSIFD